MKNNQLTDLQREIVTQIRENGLSWQFVEYHARPQPGYRNGLRALEKRGLVELRWDEARQGYAYFLTDEGKQLA